MTTKNTHRARHRARMRRWRFTYRGYTIERNTKPIPDRRYDWNGIPPDDDDTILFGASLSAVILDIDERLDT